MLILFLAGCYADTAMIEYDNRKHEVRLGDNINRALPILQNIQRTVPADWLRPADQFLENGKKYYVHYQRTGHTSDGVNTDDEFSPYVFIDDTLVSIGWTALGGPKSTGNAAAAAYNNQQASQALIDLGNALSQPQSSNTTYIPRNTQTRCRVTNSFGNQVINCNSW